MRDITTVPTTNRHGAQLRELELFFICYANQIGGDEDHGTIGPRVAPVLVDEGIVKDKEGEGGSEQTATRTVFFFVVEREQ